MYTVSDFRNGLKILLDSIPFEIVYFQHVKPGKGGAFVRTKLRNLKNNNIHEKTFRASERFERPDIEQTSMQFLYADDAYHFMDNDTFEQISVSAEIVGDKKLLLKESTVVEILRFNGEVINIELPMFMELLITECEPGVKGDTVSGATKSATVETGAIFQVPLFINAGDKIRVDTRSGEYIERA